MPPFPISRPDPLVEQESREGIHPGRRGRPCGHDRVVFYHRAAMVDHGPFRVKRDALFLHPEMCLVPCGVDEARELDPVPRPGVREFRPQGVLELYAFCSPFHLHGRMPVRPALHVHGDRQRCGVAGRGLYLDGKRSRAPAKPHRADPKRFTASQSLCSNASSGRWAGAAPPLQVP